MKKAQHVLMIGVGLIGASLSLAIKKSHPDTIISGFSHSKEELEGAKNIGVLDNYFLNLREGASQADVIFLCTPVLVTLELMQELAYCSLKSTVIITDVCSTKQDVMTEAKRLFTPHTTFIGGHPMAGSHKSGFLAGDKDLFENAFYILVSEGNSQVIEMSSLKELLVGTQAKFVELTAKEHDQITGVLSHMPHVIASLLVNEAESLMTTYPLSRKLAAGGFRDITRIASSDPRMWTDISLSNGEILQDEIEHWLEALLEFKEYLMNSDEAAIFSFFNEARRIRESIPVHQEGSIPGFHDLYINVPDHPGAIAEVTGVLASEGISLINIKIIETRDDIFGILCVSFKNEKDLDKARQMITQKTAYTCLVQ